MSNLIVEVCVVEETAKIENADRIERVRVKNWWCIAGKGQYKVGDKVVYVPPDSVISADLANRWGIAKYCAQLPKEPNGDRPSSLRVRASKFLGVSSFGTIQNLDNPDWPVGTDVLEYYGITKFEPPVKMTDGDTERDHPSFHRYTEIKRFGDYPEVFVDEEEVVVTEKLHGTNCRVGYLLAQTNQETEGECWEFMAGSHTNRRKEYNDKGVRSMYWIPFEKDADKADHLKNMIISIMIKENAKSSVIVFGEIFGCGVQDMQYGQNGKSFRIFDISVDGQYIDSDKLINYTSLNPEVKMVPILYKGPFSLAKMDELVDGPTTVCKIEEIKEPFKGREGIVIKPIKERFDSKLNGRAVLKYISASYHGRKNKNQTEYH